MAFEINQKIHWSAKPGTITAIEAGKRGKTVLTVVLDSGRVAKIDARAVDAEIAFAPAEPITAAALRADKTAARRVFLPWHMQR